MRKAAEEQKVKSFSQVFKKGEMGGDDSVKQNNHRDQNNDLFFDDNRMNKLGEITNLKPIQKE